MLYTIAVTNQGNLVAEHIVEAPNALAAINRVEVEYGEPTNVEYSTVRDKYGNRHPVMTINDWHGYSFCAQAIKAQG